MHAMPVSNISIYTYLDIYKYHYNRVQKYDFIRLDFKVEYYYMIINIVLVACNLNIYTKHNIPTSTAVRNVVPLGSGQRGKKTPK